jgi:hypothetical protein
MHLSARLWPVGLLAIVLFGFSGCNPPGPPPIHPVEDKAAEHDDDHGAMHDHDHEHEHHGHEHAHGEHGEGETFADEFQELDGLTVNVKEAFAAGETEKADGAVHEIGHVLEELSELASKDNVPAEKQTELKQAIEELFDCFGAIDNKLHGKDGASYDDVSQRIDAAMKTLRAQAESEAK